MRSTAVRGAADRGKSTSIKLAYQLLKNTYPTAEVNEIFIGNDISVIMTIGGDKIGIESQGDPNSRSFKSLKLFEQEGCKVIICATSTRGQTETAVKDLAGQYQIKWIDMKNVPSSEKHEEANIAKSRMILSAVQSAITRKHGIPAAT